MLFSEKNIIENRSKEIINQTWILIRLPNKLVQKEGVSHQMRECWQLWNIIMQWENWETKTCTCTSKNWRKISTYVFKKLDSEKQTLFLNLCFCYYYISDVLSNPICVFWFLVRNFCNAIWFLFQKNLINFGL